MEKYEGWVYLLKSGPNFKIGRSKAFDKRVKALSTLPPFDIELIHVIHCDCMIEAERKLHLKFQDKRKYGEWFILDANDVDYICSKTDFYKGEFSKDAHSGIEIYCCGAEKFKEGGSLDDNPFSPGTFAFKSFEDGYHDAVVGSLYYNTRPTPNGAMDLVKSKESKKALVNSYFFPEVCDYILNKGIPKRMALFCTLHLVNIYRLTGSDGICHETMSCIAECSYCDVKGLYGQLRTMIESGLIFDRDMGKKGGLHRITISQELYGLIDKLFSPLKELGIR